MRDLERFIVLQTVDIRWREHLENMDYMREGIHLRGMAQKDPLVEYRNEGHMMFQELIRAIREEVVTLLFHAEVTPDDGAEQLQQPPQRTAAATARSATSTSRSPAPRRSSPPATLDRAPSRRRRLGRDARRREAEGELRAREHRPQRPLLVRLGQEVQEVPRRLTARAHPARPAARRRPDPARAARAASTSPPFVEIVQDAGHPAVHVHPARPRRGVRPRLDRPLRGRAGDRRLVPASRSVGARRRGARLRGDRPPRPRARARARSATRSPRRRAAAASPPGPSSLLTALGLRRRSACSRLELRIDADEHGSERVAERSGYRRDGVLRSQALQGGPPHRRRHLVAPPRRLRLVVGSPL